MVPADNISIRVALNVKWKLIVSFKTELLSEYLIEKNHAIIKSKIGLPVVKRMMVDNDVYNSEEELEEVEEKIQQNLIPVARRTFSIIEKNSSVFLKVSNEISRLDVLAFSDKELAAVFKKWIAYYGKAAGLIGAPGRLDEFLEKDVRSELKNYLISGREIVFQALAHAERPTGVFRERIELLKLALISKKISNLELLKRVEKHSKKYRWITTTLLQGPLYDSKNIFRKIEYLKKDSHLRSKIIRLQKSYNQSNRKVKQIGKQYRFTKKFLKKIGIFRQAIWFRSVRLEWLNEGCALVRPLFSEISKRLQLSHEQLIYCFPEEIIKGLIEQRNIICSDEIQSRLNRYAMITLDGKSVSLFIGQKVDTLKQKLLTIQLPGGNEIKGTTAFPGKVRGKVRMVKDRSELSLVKKREILVTKLTTPDFVVAMEKASAIITDLGGITSHAAIVARELHKPCIVGTEIATKVLKDGDLVEVNADKGIVQIVKKS